MERTFGTRLKAVSYYDRKGTYLVAVKDGKLAVVRTAKGYFLIGGGQFPGESHEECVRRECLEETGCSIKLGSYLGSADAYGYYEKYGYFHPIQHYYTGELADKIQEPVEEDHTLEWIPCEIAEKCLYLKLQAWAVRHYLEKQPNKHH